MRSIKVGAFLKGALTFVPGINKVLSEGGGQTGSARYCYGVWLKHLVMLSHHGMRAIPRTMAELGPGASLGTGLAAMLCGVDRYYALDVVRHSSTQANLQVFDELVALFTARAARPTKGWPDYDGALDSSLFPSPILTDELLAASLAPERVERIRRVLMSPGTQDGEIAIQYAVPWSDERVIQRESIDLIISHAVLGEVDELEHTYAALHAWLRPGGMMSHQIGFGFASVTPEWNGYWRCSEAFWKIFRGRRPFCINRQPYSIHMRLLRRLGSEVVCELKQYMPGISRDQLAAQWFGRSDDDLNCRSLFVQTIKKKAAAPRRLTEYADTEDARAAATDATKLVFGHTA